MINNGSNTSENYVNSIFYNTFRKEVKMRLFRNNRADMDPSYVFKNSKRKGPHIDFHDGS